MLFPAGNIIKKNHTNRKNYNVLFPAGNIIKKNHTNRKNYNVRFPAGKMNSHSFCLKVTVLLLFFEEKNELPLEPPEEGKIIPTSSFNGYSHLSNKLPFWSQYS